MKNKNCLLLSSAVLLSFTSGVLLTSFLNRHRLIKPDDILENIKKAFLTEGSIEGTWIHLNQEPLNRFAVQTKVYHGGISRIEDSKLVQYRFTADAYTGTIINIERI